MLKTQRFKRKLTEAIDEDETQCESERENKRGYLEVRVEGKRPTTAMHPSTTCSGF